MKKTDKWLLEALVLDGQGGARHLDEEQLNKWNPEDGFLWVYLNLRQKEAISWIEEKAHMDEWVSEILTDTQESQPRALFHKDALLFVLRTVNRRSRSEPDDMVFLRLLATKDWLITVRMDPVLSINEILRSFREQDGPTDVSTLLEVIFDNVFGSINQALTGLGDSLDDIEEKILANKENDKDFEELSELQRQLVVIRRYLAPCRDAFDTLTHRRAPWFTESTEHIAGEGYHRIKRIMEDIDMLRERARINQEALQAKDLKRSQMNAYMLSAVATLFLPLSFLTGLFGMNVGGIPLAASEYGLAIVTGGIFLVGLLLLGVFKKIKWL